MPKEKLSQTEIRALEHLAKTPGADSLSLHKASKSRGSTSYITQRLKQKELALEDNGYYKITKKGLEELRKHKPEIFTHSYEREQWEF